MLTPQSASEQDLPSPLAYGTAGFRENADLLPIVLYRIGIVAALRSRNLGGKTIGVMITASHNPPEDNGVKLVDPLGEMLESSWEHLVTEVVNAKGGYEGICSAASSVEIKTGVKASVVYAIDTRESGPALAACLVAGLKKAGVETIINGGTVTTPQLHYLVRAHNDPEFGEPSIKGYNSKINNALSALGFSTLPNVLVDCANGVGALALESLKQSSALLDSSISIVNSNTSEFQQLNVHCGADYVKVGQSAPAGAKLETGKLYASFDGDADRVVLYYGNDAASEFHLLDGDKIAGLLASYFAEQLREANLFDQIQLGVVQTAYANGAAEQYVTKTLGLPVVCTSTGVKHLHHEALKFDIGVYFEANGHGTVTFSQHAVSVLAKSDSAAAKRVLALHGLINETVGDAVADLIAVLAVLQLQNKQPAKWDSDWQMLPNRLLKRAVKDRKIFITTDAERKLTSPAGLQAQIDGAVAQFASGRSFVRASGTENVVRVYAEAATPQEADDLANAVLALLDPYA